MMQTLNSDQPPRLARGFGVYQPSSGRLSRESAKAACAPFFAIADCAGSRDADERSAMIDAVVDVVPVESGRLLPNKGRRSGYLHLVVEGWVYRSSTLADGSRQITDIILPGDLCDWRIASFNDKTHDVRACGAARIAVLRSEALDEHQDLALLRAVEWAQRREARILRNRLASVGRRNARGRVAHLISELYHRLRPLGLARNGVFECPMTQEHLADALGLTSVHINRTVQALRQSGLLALNRRMVLIPSLERLHAEAGLDEEAFSFIFGG